MRTGFLQGDIPISIQVSYNPSGIAYNSFFGKEGKINSLCNLTVNSSYWYWISEDIEHVTMRNDDGWNTGAIQNNGLPFYENGLYIARAECNANNMKETYLAPNGDIMWEKPFRLINP